MTARTAGSLRTGAFVIITLSPFFRKYPACPRRDNSIHRIGGTCKNDQSHSSERFNSCCTQKPHKSMVWNESVIPSQKETACRPPLFCLCCTKRGPGRGICTKQSQICKSNYHSLCPGFVCRDIQLSFSALNQRAYFFSPGNRSLLRTHPGSLSRAG